MHRGGIEEVIDEVLTHRGREWAWKNFRPTVEALVQASGAKKVIEIGGGRGPSLPRDRVEALGIDYISNDISARELELAPDWVGKAHFDIQTPDKSIIAHFAGQYDLAFSRMVMEHVGSYRRAYENLHTILSDGGVAISFHPVLFAAPYVLNKFVPEGASQRLLKAFFPDRQDEGYPKFPAHYSGCVVSKRFRDKLKAMGFRDVWQAPFYGHGYYRKIPLLREAHAVFTDQMRKMNFTPMAALSFTIVRK